MVKNKEELKHASLSCEPQFVLGPIYTTVIFFSAAFAPHDYKLCSEVKTNDVKFIIQSVWTQSFSETMK